MIFCRLLLASRIEVAVSMLLYVATAHVVPWSFTTCRLQIALRCGMVAPKLRRWVIDGFSRFWSFPFSFSICLSKGFKIVRCVALAPGSGFGAGFWASELRRAEMRWEELRSAEKMWEDVRRAEKSFADVGREEMRRHEMGWHELRRAKKSWDKLRWDEMGWVERTWHEKSGEEGSWDKLHRMKESWGELKREKIRWAEKRWEKLRWHEKRWEQLWYVAVCCDQLRRAEMRREDMRWDEIGRQTAVTMGCNEQIPREAAMRWDQVRWEKIQPAQDMAPEWTVKRLLLPCTEGLAAPYRRSLCSTVYKLQALQFWNFRPRLARTTCMYAM